MQHTFCSVTIQVAEEIEQQADEQKHVITLQRLYQQVKNITGKLNRQLQNTYSSKERV